MSSLVESGFWLLPALLFWPLVNNIWDNEVWERTLVSHNSCEDKWYEKVFFLCHHFHTGKTVFTVYLLPHWNCISWAYSFQVQVHTFYVFDRTLFLKILFRLSMPLTWCAFLYGVSSMNISCMFLFSLCPITFLLFYFVSLLRHFLFFKSIRNNYL